MKRILTLGTALEVVVFLGPLGGCGTTRPGRVEIGPPPDTEAADVVDVLHGVPVADPYRWLEDPDAPRTREWIEHQNEYADSILHDIPGREELRELVTQLFEFESIGPPVEAGGRYFYSRRRPGQDLSVLYVREGRDGEERVLLDPHPLSEDHTIGASMLDVSADGRWIVYGVRQGGADELELHVRDVESGADRRDVLPTGLYLSVAIRPDGSGFYYALFGGEGPRVKFHLLGTDPAQDPVVFGEDATPAELLIPMVSEDGRWFVVNALQGTSGPTRISLKNLAEDGPFRTVIDDGESQSFAMVAGDRLVISTNWKAPNRRVMMANAYRPEAELWTEVVPEREGIVVEEAVGAGGRLLVSYVQNACSRLAVHDLHGKLLEEIDLGTIGSVGLGAAKWSSTETFLTFTSFHVPLTIYRYDLARGESEVWARTEIPVDTASLEVEQVFYPSKDGTRIPMFLLHRRGLVRDGATPTILTGYGGFNMSLTPAFDPTAAAWVENGGIAAVANLRGGGEYGEAWHEAGMLARKQNVFDDFAAACEFLVAEGYTSREHLAVEGGSNGGLLTGALLTQHPELVGAVVCTYPLLDMIRYHQSLLGRYWVTEYGSSEDPEQFAYLLAYSPYHNVQEGTPYPATLFVTGDLDTRVDPMHARKMTALVQARNASAEPILLRYHLRAGHAAAPPIRDVIDSTVDTLGFLAWQLGLEMR
ncbi:MAG: prolyl oligopeptidase family serine peptidase [Planctomycetota bacterium]